MLKSWLHLEFAFPATLSLTPLNLHLYPFATCHRLKHNWVCESETCSHSAPFPLFTGSELPQDPSVLAATSWNTSSDGNCTHIMFYTSFTLRKRFVSRPRDFFSFNAVFQSSRRQNISHLALTMSHFKVLLVIHDEHKQKNMENGAPICFVTEEAS